MKFTVPRRSEAVYYRVNFQFTAEDVYNAHFLLPRRGNIEKEKENEKERNKKRRKNTNRSFLKANSA